MTVGYFPPGMETYLYCRLDHGHKYLTKAQATAFHRFRRRLEQYLPDCQIKAVFPYDDNIIQIRVEIPNETYRRGLKACKLAVEVEDETGICIILK